MHPRDVALVQPIIPRFECPLIDSAFHNRPHILDYVETRAIGPAIEFLVADLEVQFDRTFVAKDPGNRKSNVVNDEAVARCQHYADGAGDMTRELDARSRWRKECNTRSGSDIRPFRKRASVISMSPNPENCPSNWNHAIEFDHRRTFVILP